MLDRKQQLLKKHRKQKRIILLIVLLGIFASGFWYWWLIPSLLVLFWVVHETWFSDHLFYLPTQDYQYQFPETAHCFSLTLNNGLIGLDGLDTQQITSQATLILKVKVSASLLGRFFDPSIIFADDVQTFERGCKGVRYINLTGLQSQLFNNQLQLRGHHCTVNSSVELMVFNQPDFTLQRIMVLAPHADDAELAAYGVYSTAENVSVVTITQGEIEAENYQSLGLDLAQAAQLKGRLRTWDSIMVPQWGGVKAQNCVQLGYYCLQLKAMQAQPLAAVGSRESNETDTRLARSYNHLTLKSDANGQPTWQNLVQDLSELLDHFQPDVVITPHPQLDPHADHVATTAAMEQAIALSEHKPSNFLFYANHLHDNDRWPMGNAGTGIALPPAMIELPAEQLWSFCLDQQQQLDKAMALGMQHDLQPKMPFKRRLRRCLQHYLAARRWPKTGENEFFRKAVRRHELFWVRSIK